MPEPWRHRLPAPRAPARRPRATRAVTSTVPSAADADTLYHYLGTLPPAARAQTIIALNPNVRGALAAIVAGDLAAAGR